MTLCGPKWMLRVPDDASGRQDSDAPRRTPTDRAAGCDAAKRCQSAADQASMGVVDPLSWRVSQLSQEWTSKAPMPSRMNAILNSHPR